jgi:bacterioferritin-associated ferredoxin
MENEKICFCTNLTKTQLKNMIEAKPITLKQLIKKTGATTYCGACFNDVQNSFFYYQYQKRICKEGNYFLFSDV